MKYLISIILIYTSFLAPAQTPFWKNGPEFNSFFQRKTEGQFKGSVRGMLTLESKTGDQFSFSFSNDSAFLNIVPDPDSVYDVSIKNYILNKQNFQFEYHTYAFANALFITLWGNRYELDLIDGGCDIAINGLEYEYITTSEKELLILHFSDKVPLFINRSCYKVPYLFIKRGSTLIFSFDIKRHVIKT